VWFTGLSHYWLKPVDHWLKSYDLEFTGMTKARPCTDDGSSGPVPCANCARYGWKYVTTREDRMMAALSGVTVRASRRLCLDCTGTGMSEQSDANLRRAG
jgi:hypothetical protein